MPAVLDLAAALAESSRSELLSEPHLMSAALDDLVQLCPVDGVLVTLRPEELFSGVIPPEGVLGAGTGDGLVVPAGASASVVSATETVPPAVEVCAEALSRLRALYGDRLALGVLLPGPLTSTAPVGTGLDRDALERVVSELLGLLRVLDPPKLDVLGVCETAALDDAALDLLERALSPLWNAVGFYSMPSLFEAASAGPVAGAVGSSAVSVWSLPGIEELISAGARRAAWPLRPPHAAIPAPGPAGFYGTAGELPADTPLEWLQAVATAVRACGARGAGGQSGVQEGGRTTA